MHFKVANSRVLNIVVFVLSVFLFQYKLSAQNKQQFPVPLAGPNQLFYLQRTQNINTIIYELNIENGKLNTETPIDVFWILYTENERRENLTTIEKDFVYGVKIKSLEKKEYQFTLAAYPKINLQLAKDSAQKYHVYVTPSKRQIKLTKVYIEEKENHFKLEPNIEFIEFIGIDLITGLEISERITL
jgi:hypothetical protein